MPHASLTVSEDSALWFRMRRQHLAGPGAPDAATAARDLVGVQAQREAPALLGLSQRVAGRPTAAETAQLVRGPRPTLVRSWGQRDTLHLYDLHAWNEVCALRPQRTLGGRREGLPGDADAAAGRARLAEIAGPFTKDAMRGVLRPAYLRSLAERAAQSGLDPVRFASSRIIWHLASDGELCLAGKKGAERLYARRVDRFPDLPWNEDRDPVETAADLLLRYLSAYGPATAADAAHFFGARVTEVKGWLERIDPLLVGVDCGGRKGLSIPLADADELVAAPPAARDWPVRLLPMWDGLLMGHKDKSWTVPREDERPAVWRKAGYVSAVVLARGRVAAVWSHKVTCGALQMEVTPLSRWRKSMAPAVRREARAIAAHLEVESGETVVHEAGN